VSEKIRDSGVKFVTFLYQYSTKAQLNNIYTTKLESRQELLFQILPTTNGGCQRISPFSGKTPKINAPGGIFMGNESATRSM
jgi:hypothetical protein